MQKLSSLISSLLNQSQRKPESAAPPPGAGGTGSQSRNLDDYPNLFAVADGKLQILKDIPGAKKAGKTVNAALLCLYGNELQGTTEIGTDTIRDLCQAHGFLDSANFAHTLRDAKEYILIGGSGKRQTAKLTVPGRKEAQRIAGDLNTA